MTTIRPLPRSLDPLPDESLPGYLLRLAHRLDLAPQRLAVLTGLVPGATANPPRVHMLDLTAAAKRDLAHAARLTTGEVTRLLLLDLADRYPPLNINLPGRTRQLWGIAQAEPWVFTTSTRCCPDCLAGDGSLIQQRHGGPWTRLWRLPVVFACTRHRRFLAHCCPTCQQPLLASSHLAPRTTDNGLHPAQCRATRPEPMTKPRHRPACATRLDTRHLHTEPAQVNDRPVPDRLLALQNKIFSFLHPDGPTTTHSLGHPTATTSYFTDLRVTTTLISASWPAALDLTDHPTLVLTLDEHLRDRHRRIASRRGHQTRPPEIVLHDRPPLPADACAAIMAMADDILTGADADTAGHQLRRLAAQAPLGPSWARRLAAIDNSDSPGVKAALQPIAAKWVKPPARTIVGHRLGPTRRAAFNHRHIPQRLPDDWYTPHFGHLTGANPKVLRRMAAMKLVRMVEGGALQHAGTRLGIPVARTASTNVHLNPWFQDRTNSAAFNAALNTLADKIDAATDLVDYGQRRDALATWTIQPHDWQTLTADLVAAETPQRPPIRATDWGNTKRLLGSWVIWTNVTQGEHLLAPILQSPALQPATKAGQDIRSTWAVFHRKQPYRHHINLRPRLDTHTDEIIHRINTGRLHPTAT